MSGEGLSAALGNAWCGEVGDECWIRAPAGATRWRVYYDGRWMDVADRRPNFEVVYVVRRHIRQIRERRFSSNDV